MGWIVLSISLVVLAAWTVSTRSTGHRARRGDRLEDAFIRARVQRMTTNGIRDFR